MNPDEAANGAALLKVFGFAFGSELELVPLDKLNTAFANLDKIEIPYDKIELVKKIKANIAGFITDVKATKRTVKDNDPAQWETLYKTAMDETKATFS